jgi:hypothetical protein
MEIIGRSDRVDFPEFELENLPVKTDTGAYTSSIHCSFAQVIEENGESVLEYQLLDPSYPEFSEEKQRSNQFSLRTVKNSFGESEERYAIRTKIVLFGEEHIIRLTLSERSNMKFPVLLGRKFLNGKFLVNTAIRNQSYRRKKKSKSQ